MGLPRSMILEKTNDKKQEQEYKTINKIVLFLLVSISKVWLKLESRHMNDNNNFFMIKELTILRHKISGAIVASLSPFR